MHLPVIAILATMPTQGLAFTIDESLPCSRAAWTAKHALLRLTSNASGKVPCKFPDFGSHAVKSTIHFEQEMHVLGCDCHRHIPQHMVARVGRFIYLLYGDGKDSKALFILVVSGESLELNNGESLYCWNVVHCSYSIDSSVEEQR